VAVCPNGTRVKPSVTEEYLWVEASTLCEQISWVATWMAPVCRQLLPRMVDIRELCASEPDPLPEIDLVGLAVAGQLTALPQLVADWIWARWTQVNWDTFCECNPSSGSGPCPPLPEVSLVTNRAYNDGIVKIAERPLYGGFTNADVVLKTVSPHPGGGFQMSAQMENASHVALGPPANTTMMSFDPNQTTHMTSWNQLTDQQRLDARFLSVWARGMGGPTGSGSLRFDYGVAYSATFTGTCQGIEVIPPPPVVPPEPPVPDAPPMPTVDPGCDLDDICEQLAAIAGLLGKLHERVGVIQRYGVPFTYGYGLVHPNLSGEGEFAIGALVGFKIDLTSAIPGRQLEGKPDYLWDLGWLTIGTADGMIDEKRFTRELQVWQPPRIQEARWFGYHFKAGVVATVTELTPAPY